MKELTNYCSVREQMTTLMVSGRERGVTKEQVLSKLPALTATSDDAEISIFSRLEDVYAFKKLSGKTIFFHRVSRCMMRAMLGHEEKYDDGLENTLLACQDDTGGDLSSCVVKAHSKHLVK